jgi:hypothetical protein
MGSDKKISRLFQDNRVQSYTSERRELMATKKSAAKKKTSTKGRAKVGKVMHEYKHGQLKSGSGRKVKNPKQAIAIGLSEARKAGAKVPPKKGAAKKGVAKKGSAKKSTAKKVGAKKGAAKKGGRKKS